MDARSAETVIIVPTLSVIDAAPVIRKARNRAGIDCAVLLASDYEARGAVVVGNVLFKAALDWGAKYLCYLNDDTGPFPHGWLKRLVEVMEANPIYGVVVPGCPCRGGMQKTIKPGMPPKVVELNQPSAWVVALLRAEMIRQVGWLDENLRHYADDTDYEWRMHALGWKTALVQDVWIGHDWQRERAVDTHPWYRQDVAYVKQKHGR